MRKESIIIYERDFAYCLAGQLYDQAPGRKPRKADIIINKALEAFNQYPTHGKIFGDSNTVSIEKDKVYDFCHEILYNIPEFLELNLSQVEYEKGISVDDENRPKFSFTSMYDIETEDSIRNDFIDLDAFVGNVSRKLYNVRDKDCFLCVHDDNKHTNEYCLRCVINPSFTNNYESERFAKGKYTIVCNYDCYKAKYICCTECDEKDTCQNKCDSNPVDCENHK